MRAELGRHFLNFARVGSTALAITAASGAFESPKNFGRNSDKVYASELNSPLEQNPVLIEEALARYPKLLAEKDIESLTKYLYGPTNFYWELPQVPFKYSSKEEFVGLLRQALVKGYPRCVGYKRVGGGEMRVLFENLSLQNSPDASGTSYLSLAITPSVTTVSFLLAGVLEVAKKDLESEKREVTPCDVLPSSIPPRATPTPTPKPELPPAIAKTKFIYVTNKDDSRTLYQANLEKKENLELVGSGVNPKSADWLDKDTLVYSSARGTIYYPWSGIRTRNLKTGKDEWLFDEEKREESLDSCPAVDGKGNISFIRHDMRSVNFSDTITTLYKKSQALERLTRDGEEANNCLHFSPNGRLVAFRWGYSGVDAGFGEIQVYSTETFEKDYLAQRPLYRIPGIDVFDWSPDGNKLLIRRVIRLSDRSFSDRGYSFDLQSGKEELIGGGFLSAIWSADGTWVLASVKTGQKESSIHGYNKGVVGPITVLKSAGEITFLKRYPVRFLVPEGNIVAFFPGLGSVIRNNRYASGMFDELRRVLVNELDYDEKEIFLGSLGGNTFLADGTIVAKDQDCDMLLKNLDYNSEAVLQTLRELDKHRPNHRKLLLGHSLGTIRLVGAFQRIKDEKLDINIQGARVLLVNGPIIGIRTYGFEWVPAQYMTGNLDPDCNLSIGPFNLGLPLPSQINFPAIVELKEVWDKRNERRKKLAELTEWMKTQGAEIITFGNANDCVVALGSCYLTELGLEVALMAGVDPDNLVMYTQYVPGATNIMRFLGHGEGFSLGHKQYFTTEEGLAILSTVIGRQQRNN